MGKGFVTHTMGKRLILNKEHLEFRVVMLKDVYCHIIANITNTWNVSLVKSGENLVYIQWKTTVK